MEIWQLKTFSVVAKHLHFTNASKELGLTQSAVSYQIKALEQELGVSLFLRNKGKVELTSQGNKLLNYAFRILDQVEQMKHEIKENSKELKGNVRISAVTYSLNTPFPMFRDGFREVFEDIELSFQSAIDTKTILDDVRNGSIDIGLITKSEGESLNIEDFLHYPCLSYELLVVVGKDHPVAEKQEVFLSELVDEKWILHKKGSLLRDITEGCFYKYNFEPKQIYESSEGNVVTSITQDGEGIAVLPKWGILEQIENGSLVPIKLKDKENTEVETSMVISRNRRSKIVDAFVEYFMKTTLEGFKVKNIIECKE